MVAGRNMDNNNNNFQCEKLKPSRYAEMRKNSNTHHHCPSTLLSPSSMPDVVGESVGEWSGKCNLLGIVTERGAHAEVMGMPSRRMTFIANICLCNLHGVCDHNTPVNE